MPAPAHDVRKRKNRNRPPHVAAERARSLYEDEAANERRADGPVGNRDAQEVLGAVGSGQPLAPWLQQRMEDLLGVDLTRARVHTNAAPLPRPSSSTPTPPRSAPTCSSRPASSARAPPPATPSSRTS